MKPEHVFDTAGDWVATRVGDNIFDLSGIWVGWLDGKDVYTTDGEYVGWYNRDQRILRKRVKPSVSLRTDIPPQPEKPELPARAPLPPMFEELTFDTVDVFEEDPDIFRRVSDLRPDMD